MCKEGGISQQKAKVIFSFLERRSGGGGEQSRPHEAVRYSEGVFVASTHDTCGSPRGDFFVCPCKNLRRKRLTKSIRLTEMSVTWKRNTSPGVWVPFFQGYLLRTSTFWRSLVCNLLVFMQSPKSHCC